MSPLTTILFVVGSLCIMFILFNTYMRAVSPRATNDLSLETALANGTYVRIVVAGGCFWCTEAEYEHVSGVVSAMSGYTSVERNYTESEGPRYAEVSSGEVKAREAVEVIYDPRTISTETILELYMRHIDPTDAGGQFADRGYQYSPAIYYTTEEQAREANALLARIGASRKFAQPTVVEVLPAQKFYLAEEYHQNYKDKNSVRYAVYREGSGRNAFVREHWVEGAPFIDSIFKTQPMTTSWNLFTEEQKQKRIKELTPIQYEVTQEEGTERPYDNAYHDNKESGIYVDLVSGEPLFLSTDKYDSGTGWPSFVRPIDEGAVTLHEDKRLFSVRTEVRSAVADSHLGHVFDDGPQDRGGKRYCMNSAALRFVGVSSMEAEGYGAYIERLNK
ncbi:MAG: peptide-methionine (R)-S-oxide reductase MsrB [Candidatus Pacebacteria bacterium]|nr:peptide-methionine (R)-S-oxide reductase MsrB [Candidatus Paceibacterota bacterium]